MATRAAARATKRNDDTGTSPGRPAETFEANAVSLRLLSFHCTAADLVLSDAGPTPTAQAKRLETTLGAPSAAAVLQLQAATAALKHLDSWGGFFNRGVKLGPAPPRAFLARWLRRALELSDARGYHNQRRALLAARDARDARRADQEEKQRRWEEKQQRWKARGDDEEYGHCGHGE